MHRIHGSRDKREQRLAKLVGVEQLDSAIELALRVDGIGIG